jgi:uncharacterized Zn-binding protein involved in type VI secretion
MGQPAARVGDLTSHGTPLTPLWPWLVCFSVRIGGMPAWRAGVDLHVCQHGSTPYFGVVKHGSSSVRIGGMPAARQGDLITELAGENKIEKGCPKVRIG